MPDEFEGTVAVVTGAARGIGRSIAERLGEEGASVVVADIDAEEARETAAELGETGIAAEAVGCDVTSVDDVTAMVERTVDRFGSLDVLVNNAGIGSSGSVLDLDFEEWHRVIDVNLNGVFNCSRVAAPELVEAGGGSIINISSMAGRNISYHAAANYTASKWGVIGLTKHMAWDLGEHGVRVNAVCPGSTITSLTESSTTEAQRAATAEKIPLNRWAEPRDQADAVVYLASEAGSYVTGTVLEVDGGKQLGVRHEI